MIFEFIHKTKDKNELCSESNSIHCTEAYLKQKLIWFKKSSFWYLILFLIAISCLHSTCEAQEKVTRFLEDKDFSLDILGEVKTFKIKEKENTSIITVDGVILKVDNMVTTARRAAWIPFTNDLYLEENIEVNVNGSIFRAEQMIYNIKERRGYIVAPFAILKAPDQINEKGSENNNVIAIEKGRLLFIQAKSATITKEEFLLKEISITTNGFLNPFYQISASSAVYESGKSLQSWNNTLKIGKIPIFYFPYLARDLQNNWPWVKVRLDQNSRYGLNGELQIKAFFNDNAVTAGWRPMELRGNQFSLEYERKKDNDWFLLSAEGIREHWKPQSVMSIDNITHSDDDIQNDTLSTENRYRTHAIIKKDMMWNFSFDLEIDKIDSTNTFIWKQDDVYSKGNSANISPFEEGDSDLKKSSYRRDYHRDEFYEYKSPESIGQLKWIKGPYAARLIYKQNINEFKFNEERNNNEELEIKPGFLFDVNSVKIFDFPLPIYIDSHTRLESLEKEFTDENQKTTNIASERFFTQTLIQTEYSLFNRFNLNAWGGAHETGYSDLDVQPKIKRGNDGLLGEDSLDLDFEVESHTSNNLNRFVFVYGGALNFTLNNHFGWNSNLLNLNGVIHRITPSIEFFGSGEPNKKSIELPQFDEFDEFEKDDKLKFQLRQQFLRSDTLEDWIVWRTWSFYYLDRPGVRNRPQNLYNEFQFNINKFLILRTFFLMERGEGLVKSLNQLTIKNDSVSLKITERWEVDYPWQTDAEAEIKIGSRYKLFGGGAFINKKSPEGSRDIKGIVDYHFGITKRVHEFSFSLEFKNDRLYDEKSLGFYFRVF